MKNLYTAFLCLLGVLSALMQCQANNLPPITGNTIGSDQTICNNTVPAPITGSIPGGGTGVYTYQWQVSTTSAIAGFASIAGGTAQGYSPAALVANHWYRRIVASGIALDTTSAVTITVTPVITAASNTVTAVQTICFNTAPATLNGSTPTGGNGTYAYQWQSSPNNVTFTAITGAAAINYTAPTLTANTWYNRIVGSGGCSNTSASIKITVTPIITNDIISANQSICSGQSPLGLTGTAPAGGTGAFTYQWLSSITSATTGFANASGVSTTNNYAPGALTQTTWYRRMVSSGGCVDTAAAVTITVVNSAPGNPAVFGNGVWNAYAYSDNAFTTYAGYYTEPSLSFISTGQYTVNQSPSSAPSYQGCLIQPTFFSVSFKRTNFTTADYQVDLTGVDDNVTLFVNGVQVYTKGCCTNPPTVVSNIWTGYLGVTDQVEIRWSQNAGPSIVGMNFTPVTPAPLNPGAIAGSQSVCYGQMPANGFTNVTTPTSGCSIINGYQWQSSIDSVTWTNIPGATALTYTVGTALTQTTWYHRVTTDACNNSSATAPVQVFVNVVPPGNPSVFGNNVWNVYGYSDNAFTTYAGYYTEPSLSFISTSRYTNNQSPSSASGYQGCLIAPTNFSASMKRTNFTPAIYQIDLTGVDDNVWLLINGVQVYTKGCCTNPPTVVSNIWTGPLGATDQVEIRWSQNAGPSIVGMNFTPVTPSPLLPSTITPNQTICAGNIPPTPLTQSALPSGGCTLKGYQWEYSTDNGTTWTAISGATAISYTITNSIYTQTLYHQITSDICGNSATSLPDTIYMNNTAPGNPTVFGNNVWNVYCFQDINFSIYAGYYTEPLLTFSTPNRYSPNSPPSDASGYQGCQLINTYYSTSMKRTGFTAGTYQIDVTLDDDFTQVYIDGNLVSSLTYPTVQNNIWTGNLGPTDQIEVRWGNYGGPGNTGLRFTLVTPTPLSPGTITANNPNLCPGNVPAISNTTAASGGCYPTYSWQSSVDGGVTWTTIAGATGLTYTATISPSGNIEYERVATDACGNTATTAPVSFIQGGGAVGNPAVYGNGVWNVYCYDANGAAFSSALYLGYYVEPLLSFNSANRWNTNTGSPSDASGYQGCTVDHDNDWVSYRQKNFPPGTYQLNIPDHDDDVYLYVDGVLVFSQAGCCTANNNVWTGTLGASDFIEFRWTQYYGASIGELTFVPVGPAASVTPGVVGTNQTICYNSIPAAFTSVSAAVSTCYVSYRWQSSPDNVTWTNITGATTAIYSVGAPLIANTYYRRMASDACGNTANSNTLTISLYSNALTAGTIAANQTICSGAVPAALTSTGLPVGGDGNFVYQWQSSPDNIVWTNIAGATAVGYTPGALAATTYYRRNVSCCSGTLTASSAALTITVNKLPAITVQPANGVACSGGNTSFSVTATGASPTYQWQVNPGTGFVNATNGALYGGVTTATMSITGATAAMNGYTYRVIISGTCTPAVTSNTVTLTIGVNPTISSQPSNQTVCVGSTASYSVTASGSGLTYQWYENKGAGFNALTDGGIYSGSLTNNLVLTGVTAAMTGYTYKCTILSSCAGTITTAVASLTVVAALTNTITANQTICTGTTPAVLVGSTGGTTYLWQSSTISGVSGFVTASGGNNGANYTPTPGNTSTWYQRIESNSGCSSTSNVISITVNPTAIAISGQPTNQLTCAGGTVSFSVTASGPGTLTYQWYEKIGAGPFNPTTDGGIYSGSTTSALTLTGVGAAMNGNKYEVKVFASGCTASSLTSGTATLTTNNSPVITVNNPATITICSGNNVNINITATGIGLTYQWQQNLGSGWNNLSNNAIFGNVNGAQLTIIGATASMNGSQYQCLVMGTCSPAVTSATSTMTVYGPIASNSISSSQTLCAGTPLPFTVSTPTGGSGSYTYQWQQNIGSGWTNITGATSINYSPGLITQTTQYQRIVSDGFCGNSTSVSIVMTINPPTSTGDPSNITVCAGTNASFTVVAVGTNLTYQWQVNPGSGTFSNISNGAQYTGAKTATLTVIAPAYGFNGYQYRCVVSGNCSPPSVTSNPATLTVNPVASITSQPVNANSCQGSTVSFSVTASGLGLTYQWFEKVGAGPFNPTTDGGIYSGSTTSTLTLTGISTAMNNNQYMVVITLGTCPVSSSVASLTVSAQPALVVTNPSPLCAPATVDITAASVTAGSNLAGGTLSYWKDAATTIPLSNPNSVSVSATYYIRVGTSPVCYAVNPVVVNVNAAITNNTISAAQNLCTGTAAASLTGGIPGGGTGTYTYQWQSSPDNVTWSNILGATSSAYSPGILASTTYYQRIVNSGVCSSTSPSIAIAIYPYPVAGISYAGTPYCATGTATVTQTGQAGGTYTAPAAVSITAATGAINLAMSTAGTYTITYSFSNGVCNSTTTTSITITALPTATISYAGSPYCATGTATVTQTGTVGGTYTAPAGVSITAATGAINLATSSAGTYTVTYSFTVGACSNTATTSITITALPTATIAYGGSPYCATGTATVTQTGTAGGTYTAPAGISIAAATGAINLATSTPGTYTITYSFTSGACSNTATTSITITALPTATIAYSGSPYCATGTATVTQTGTAGGTYTAPAGVSITAATGAINLATSTPGTYTITYSFTVGACSNTATTSITITALPTATISYAGSPYCATGTATVTQTGTAGGTYTAPAGVSITAATGAINLATSAAGTYTITYSFTVGACSNTATTSITITALPTATIAYSGSPYCATGTATVTQTGTAGGTYTAPAGVSITAATGAINLATSTGGTYTITYSFTSGACSNTATTSITITALPIATISYAGSPYCATGTATVTRTGTAGGTYTAPAGVSITAATGAINLATSTPGTYTITYSFTSGACSNTATTSITITALPTATISYAGSPYCATGTATVTRTGTAGGTYTAPAEVSITAATGAINLATSTPGTYTITYSFTVGACSNTATTSITITALPTATISYVGSPYCATGTATVTQTGTAGGTYTAPAGVSITAATGAINLATSTPGTYTITYSFTVGACSNTATTSITITALPIATIAYSGSAYCATGTATVTQTGQAGGTYTAPAGLSITAATGAINLATSTPGTYTITYSFTVGACSNTATTSITIIALPTATIAYSGSPYCATGTATVTQTGIAGGTYSAPAGVSITAATGAINLATSTPGTYTITYSFTVGACSNTATTSITITSLPTATIAYSGSPYCATGTATVTQTGTAGGTYTAPAGISITAATGAINLATSTPGTYTITYSFTVGACSNTATTSITITALPIATISYVGSPYCATGTATVTQTGTAGGTYTAPAGVSITAATGAINLATSTAGTYTITYSFTVGACSNTATTSITITALPTATIAYSGSPYCATGTATVTQTGTAGGTYTAPAGVSITAATGAINLATSTPGTYTITYSFTSGACSNTATTSITITALPTASIAYGGSPYCATGTATVTQTGTAGGTYTAPAGVSITAATGAINLATSTPGTYTITYSFTSGACSNTATTSITITALPTATIAYSGSPYCATGTATVTQTGTAGGTYTAPAGVSITAATGAINLATSTPGTYTITYSFTVGACSNTATTSITITTLPTATIAYGGSPYCATGTATITQTGTAGGTYTAPAGVSITAATGAINLATSTPGTYTITYSFTSGACSNTATTSITITALPTATIAYSGSPYCATGTATITQTGTAGGTYTGPAGVSITAATGAINLATSTPGTYTIIYSFTVGACSNTATTSITITALPTATIAYSGSPYCATGIATVTQTGTAGGTYTAPAGVSITAATGVINLATSTPGIYTITYSFTSGACSNTATTSITITALPTATIAYSGSPYCATGTANVTQMGVGGGTYSSTAGLNINAVTGDINLVTSTPGIYTVTYSFTNGTCNNNTTASVNIILAPQVIITNPAAVCIPSTVDLTAASVTAGSTVGLTYTYYTDAAATSVLSNPNAVAVSGTYYIKGTNVAGCSDIQPIVVTINTLPTATISYAGSPYCATGTATVSQTGTAGGTYTAPAGVSITAATGDINLATSTPGTYTITYSFTNGICSNTTTGSITINGPPTATISYAGSPYCATGTATVTQTGQAGGTYTAPAGLSITAATGAINLATSTPGTYTVTYTFTNGTCSNTATTSITITALPTATISYAGSPYCATGTATVTQTGTAGGTYTAPAGVSITAATGAINLAASTPGTYTITYTFTNGTCSNTTTASITINSLPIATISYAASPYCATGTAAVTQTGQAGGTYTAPAGVSITAATGAINLATSTPGTYTITYSFTNGTCSNTTTASITINALPTATIDYAGSPYCATGIATVTQTGQAGGTYTAPAGVSITSATGAIDLATSTPGTYIVTYSFGNGTCNNTTTTSITINALPIATISYAESPYCATGTATVTQTGQAGGTYTAPAGVLINGATGDINLATSTPGTYTVTYSFSNGTCSNSTTASVTIILTPQVIITNPAAVCSPATVDLTAASVTTGSTAGLTFAYFTDAAATLVLSNPNAVAVSGTYYIKGSAGSGCSDIQPVVVTINALPIATISYAGSPYCATGIATITQTGQAGGTYSAPAGASITAATGDIDLATSTPGTYTITYSFGNGTCNNTATTSVTINALPTATISYAGSPYCATGTASVTQTGQGGGTYSSTAGLNIIPATGDINLATSTPGTYTITYSFNNGTCSNTTTASITINALPIATISYGGSPYCATATATVTQTGQPGGAYTAPAGIVINAATGDINLAASTPGTYTITYSFGNGTCSNSTTASVTITIAPQVLVTNPPAVCSPATVDITAAAVTAGSTAGLIYSYYQDAATTIPLANPNAIALSSTYYIQGATASGCADVQAVVVTINPKPAVVITNPAAVCWPNTVDITSASTTAGSTAGLIYTYFKDAAATLVLSNPNAIALNGTYYIQGTSVSGCSDIQPVVVTINLLPTALISYNGSPYCSQGTAYVSLTGQAGGTYSSSPGLIINSGTGDIDLVSSTEGTYTVVYTFSNGTCTNSSITSVTIKNPVIQVNNPPGICFPETVNLTNPSVTAGSESGLNFNFYQDAGGLVPVPNPATVGASGTYYVKGVNSSTGCASDISPVMVTIFPKPAITANSSETDICKGSSVTLTASSPGNSIDWAGVGLGKSVSVTPMDSTGYLAIATTTDGCMDTATVNIAVNPFKINLIANPDPVLAGTSTTMTTNGNFTYSVLSWSPDIFFTDQTALTQTIVVKDTSKSFTVIAKSDDGCLDTATLNVVVDPNLKDFFIPNSFSPNNDGNNDIFKVYGSSVRDVILLVYNQWGELISETHNAQGGWDGTWKGRPQPVGVYVYEAKVTFYNNVTIKRKGTVNLIR